MGGIQIRELSKLAIDIWKWCERRNFWIFASWIRSQDNIIADLESRKLERETEFALSEATFGKASQVFGIPEIDLFASKANTRWTRYVS